MGSPKRRVKVRHQRCYNNTRAEGKHPTVYPLRCSRAGQTRFRFRNGNVSYAASLTSWGRWNRSERRSASATGDLGKWRRRRRRRAPPRVRHPHQRRSLLSEAPAARTGAAAALTTGKYYRTVSKSDSYLHVFLHFSQLAHCQLNHWKKTEK